MTSNTFLCCLFLPQDTVQGCHELSHHLLSSSAGCSAGHYVLHIFTRAAGKMGCFPGAWQRVHKEGNTAGTATTTGVKVSISSCVLKPLGFYLVHPLPSSLASTCYQGTTSPHLAPCSQTSLEVNGKDKPASVSTQQAACSERSFLSHWKHHEQHE